MTNRTSLREKANRAREYRCRNLIGVLEHPRDIRNIGTFVRNINALGVEKAYIVTDNPDFPAEWESMRNRNSLLGTSASAIKWTFVRVFPTTEACLQRLEDRGFASIATSPHQKGKDNVLLHEGDYTRFRRLAVWFGSEGRGLSDLAIARSRFCVQIPMAGIVESLNLGTCSGIVLYEVARQRREYQKRKAEARAAKAFAGLRVAMANGCV